MRFRSRWHLALGVLAACSDAPEGTVTIVTGEETDVFSRAPAPTTLVTEKIALDGTRTELRRTPLPADTVDLGNLPQTDAGALGVRGLDAAGKPVVRGETLFVQWGALASSQLEVFVQRTGELARMPRGPGAFDPLATTIVAGRYALAANGTATMVYDLLGLKPITSPVLPRPARSIASFDTSLLVVDEGGATTFELSTSTSYPLDAPTGGTFAEIAGGQRTIAPDGTQYLVGATRAGGGATARVLVLDAQGKATFASLGTPREGACATYVEGRGLVVVGGDPAAPGAELLAPGASVATPLPFPPDAARGCAATAVDAGHVAIIGGSTTVEARVLDLACASSCTPTTWQGAIPLVRAEAITLAPDALFVLGDDAGGASHAYRASPTGTREIPLRVPRRGARLLRSPTGAALVVGGAAGIEQYFD